MILLFGVVVINFNRYGKYKTTLATRASNTT